MILLPSCLCCGQSQCPRLCSQEFRYVHFRFRLAAASGNPIVNTPLKTGRFDFTKPIIVNGFPVGFEKIAEDWTPPEMLGSVSSPEIDETVVLDLQEPTPEFGNSITSGTYARIIVSGWNNGNNWFYFPCQVVAEFNYKLTLGSWRTRQSGNDTVGLLQEVSESVGMIVNIPYPWVRSVGVVEYGWSANWNTTPSAYNPSWGVSKRYRPAAGVSDCSDPDQWPLYSQTTDPDGPVQGQVFKKPDTPTNTFQFFEPYQYTTPPNLEWLKYEGDYVDIKQDRQVEYIDWRRILPDPTVEITLSNEL